MNDQTPAAGPCPASPCDGDEEQRAAELRASADAQLERLATYIATEASDSEVPGLLVMAERLRSVARPAPDPGAALAAVLAAVAETRWRVYTFGAGEWAPAGTACDSPDKARRKEQHLTARCPGMPTAIVRESRTYQTEED